MIRAVFNDVTIAESDATVVVEGNHYFPPDSIDWDRLSTSRTTSICPWKGLATYFDVQTDGAVEQRAAWCYRHPLFWVRRIRGHVAFWGAVRMRE